MLSDLRFRLCFLFRRNGRTSEKSWPESYRNAPHQALSKSSILRMHEVLTRDNVRGSRVKGCGCTCRTVGFLHFCQNDFLDLFHSGLVAFVEGPLLDSLRTSQPSLAENLHVFASSWLTHAKFPRDQAATDPIPHQIAISPAQAKDNGAYGRRSSAIRYCVTTVLLKAILGSEQYHSMNSRMVWSYERFELADVRMFKTADFDCSRFWSEDRMLSANEIVEVHQAQRTYARLAGILMLGAILVAIGGGAILSNIAGSEGTTVWFMRIHASQAETAWGDSGLEGNRQNRLRICTSSQNLPAAATPRALCSLDAEAGARCCRLRYTLYNRST
jgi:hypothetical protein